MELYSTKRISPEVNIEQAVFRGLPPDNGLYMPTHIPQLPTSFFEEIDQLSLQEIAVAVSQTLLDGELPASAIKALVEEAINFEAPLVEVEKNIFSLELFHGPTLAFKDFGARFMSRLMGHFLTKEEKEIHILVATSGDTGSAVAQGFLGVPRIKVTILYPSGKVSEIQEKQLTTIGQNITALEVEGTFDDCQKLVKQAFLDEEIRANKHLTSANSINIARLIPQSFYYFNAYARTKALGKPLVFCVPSGNFGNLCGGLIAMQMGLPVHKFIAATNANHIVPDYLAEGKFSPKPSVKTIANAMDVGNPSNFPRMMHLLGEKWETVKNYISGAWYTDAQIRETMANVYQHLGYVMCPHTAIGYRGLTDALATLDGAYTGVFLATAHPAKFTDVVEPVIGQPVEIPPRLQASIDKTKRSVKMPNDFSLLKKYLLED